MSKKYLEYFFPRSLKFSFLWLVPSLIFLYSDKGVLPHVSKRKNTEFALFACFPDRTFPSNHLSPPPHPTLHNPSEEHNGVPAGLFQVNVVWKD